MNCTDSEGSIASMQVAAEAGADAGCPKQPWKQEKRSFKKKKQAAKVELRKACKEAKAKYRVQVLEAKQALTQVKKAEKSEKKRLKHEKKVSKKAAKFEEAKASPPWPQNEGPVDVCPSAPPADKKSPLEVLAEMGFENIELNVQLLEAKNNNIQAVLQVLLGGDDASTSGPASLMAPWWKRR